MRLFGLVLLLLSSLSNAETEFQELELLSYRLSSSFAAFIFLKGTRQKTLLKKIQTDLLMAWIRHWKLAGA